MGSFSIALTGLRAQSQALNTIGNNLANLNTTAYKLQSTTFSDLFYQQVGSSGSGNPLQQGLGVRVSGTQTDFGQGTISTTSDAADLAIQGNGFFVIDNNGTQELTRAGNFELSNAGMLQTEDGLPLMGYQAVNGVASVSGPLGSITLPTGETQAAKATSNITMSMNLNSDASTGTEFSSSIKLYDSLGTSHTATVTFTKTDQNEWSYSVSLPSGESTGSSNTTGTLTFDSSGNLVSPSGSISGISFSGLSDGASDLSFNWNLNDAAGNATVSQTSSASAVATTTQDGYESGTYTGFTIASDGTVSAQFSNGQTEAIAMVALANVANVQGLTRVGDNAYMTTAASGEAVIGGAGTGGRGQLEDDALEGSNVDISTEFSNLIVAQRAFEANSKTVTTFDTIAQETINLIR
ncbi:MAG: flagellar hook protein FlgE [Acidobacteriaceae bacterium]|nr:flagellar hook protein FlgE [Acidobacteriaceae bacterium]